MNRITPLALLTCLAPAFADPQTDSWFTANSGRYARIYQTTANETARTSSSTWSRGQGVQASPVYADINEVRSSATYVYIRSPGLASHLMGPWYLDAAKSQNFPNFPANNEVIYRIPRNPTIPTNKTLTGLGATGRMVNGVAMFDSRDAFSYSNGSATDATPVNGVTGDGIWNRDGYHNEGVTFDPALAHQAGEVYHYHAHPIALRHQLGDHVDYNPLTNRYTERAGVPSAHSPIVAWAADGLPVYGPYGYASPLDPNSGIRRMVSGFALRNGQNGTTAITVRQVLPLWAQRVQNRTTLAANQYGPAVNATYQLGHYIEDFEFRGDLGQALGVDFDLNEQNVRFCVTPDFPSGTWAYFTPLNADGTPAYPYTTGRQYYGAVTGGATNLATMNADTPQTVHFLGGANAALAITATNLVATTVTLAWSAVEGGTYAVEASPDATTWTSKATGIAATGTSTNRSYTALGTAGTEYGRVTRTALATYDTAGSAAATVAQSATATYLLGGVNTPPTIGNIADLSTPINTATAALPFLIADGETPAANLTLSAASDNPTLVPVANIALGGTGANRTATVTPAASRTGSALITLTVSDGVHSASTAFTLTVTGTNTAPTLGTVADQTLPQNGASGPLALLVNDVESDPSALVLSASSSNPTLIPPANIVFGGTGGSRTVSLTPVTGQTGASTLTLTVSDGVLSASTSFLLTVLPTAPVLGSLHHTPLAPTPTDSVTVTARITPFAGRSITTAQLTYVTGESTTSTVFNETMAAAAAVAWTGTNANHPWTVAFTGPPASPFAQTAAANHTPVGQGNAFGMEITANAPAIANSTLTTTNPINAAGSAGFVEFYLSSSGLTGTLGWDFQTSTNGTTYTTRLGELTGSNHAFQRYQYDLTPAERVGTLRLRFRFAGPGMNNVPRVNLDDIRVVVTSGALPVSVPLLDNGLAGDGAANDGIYGAFIPALPLGTTVSYNVTATDSAASTTTSATQAYTVAYPPPYSPLIIPEALSGTSFDLELHPAEASYVEGALTETRAFNSQSFWGPTLILNQGDDVRFQVTNTLAEATTLHWHGLQVPAILDGGPRLPIAPGGIWRPNFTIHNSAGTHWYHPHLHDSTREQFILGAGGFILVRDPVEAALNLPRTYGVDDIPLALTSRRFAAHQLVVEDSEYGDVVLVNGGLNPQATLPGQMIRLRLLNAELERRYHLGVTTPAGTDRTFHVIATDGGMLDAPLPVTRAYLSPGERLEILLDLTGDAEGATFDLKAYNGNQATDFPGGEPATSGPRGSLLNNTTFTLLHLQVGPRTAHPVLTLPAILVTNTFWEVAHATTTRTVRITDGNPGGTAYRFDHQDYAPAVINHTVQRGAVEQWNIVNESSSSHTFHLHGTPFTLLARTGGANPGILDYEQGWKDTVFVGQNQTVSFLARFDRFASTTNPHYYHAHYAGPGDNGLLGQFLVVNNEVEDLVIDSVAREAGQGAITLQLRATPGTTYALEYTTDLISGAWVEIGTITSDGTSAEFVETDPARLAQPSSFYRATIPQLP